MMRPVLRYFGGKHDLARWIIAYFPPHQIYCEPFSGAASVLMNKPRARMEIYNDLAGNIVNVFSCLRDNSDELRRLCELTPFARTEYELAMSGEEAEDEVERARRTIFSSFAGFGGNSTMKINAGFNIGNIDNQRAISWATYPNQIAGFTKRLKGVAIESMDALDCIRKYDNPDTLFYVDPPYNFKERKNKSKTYLYEYDEGQHEKLAEVLHAVKGKVVLSGYDGPMYSRLYDGWERESTKAMDNSLEQREEVLWFNYEPNRQEILL